MRDGTSEVHRRPVIAVVRDGKNACLRTGQPLQAGPGHADLKYAIDLVVRNLTVAFDAHQTFRFQDEIFYPNESSSVGEGKRTASQGDAAKLFGLREGRDLIEQRQRFELAICETQIAFDAQVSARQRRVNFGGAGEFSMETQ